LSHVSSRLSQKLYFATFSGVFQSYPREYEDKGHWATPEAPAHREIHRCNYETWIINKFATPGLTERVVIDRLRECKTMLKYGGYPPEIVKPKDATWNGE
jgi:hypothetical protein